MAGHLGEASGSKPSVFYEQPVLTLTLGPTVQSVSFSQVHGPSLHDKQSTEQMCSTNHFGCNVFPATTMKTTGTTTPLRGSVVTAIRSKTLSRQVLRKLHAV